MKKAVVKIAFSAEEAACAIGTTRAVMANWRCAKVGPRYYKQNRKVFYMYEDLTAWLKMHPVITKDAHDIESA